MGAVNYRGVDAVCRYIESTGMYAFSIYPLGRAQAKPLFKQTQKVSSAKAAEKFRDWANVIIDSDPNHNIDYELRLSEGKDVEGSDEVELTGGRGGMVCSFNLSTSAGGSERVAAPAMMGGISMDMYLQVLNAQYAYKSEADSLRAENERLKSRVLELEEELDEMDEPQDADGVGQLGNVLMPFIMKTLQGASAPNNPVNGIPEEISSDDYSPKLKAAITKLRKYDTQLDSDLTLLASLAEKEPGKFAFMLDALRNM